VTEQRLTEIIDGLFVRAKAADEFEYACALLRVRGNEDYGWDPLRETQQLFNDVISLIQLGLTDTVRRRLKLRPRLTDAARLRLGLLLYSHLTEVDAVYETLANLVTITTGERYTMDPFGDLYRPPDRARYEQHPPSARRVVDHLKTKAAEADANDLVEVLDWFFNDAVRNAFFHSDYILYGDEFRSREGQFVDADGRRGSSLRAEAVADLINRSVLFFQVFTVTFEKHRRSYRADREIEGRLGADGGVIPVVLLADPRRGLYGVRA
jgi:hypothetical protein